MKRSAMLGWCLLALGLAAPAAHAVRLEYKVKAGDQWKQKITIAGNGTMEAAGMKFEMDMDIVSNVGSKVKTVNQDGSFVSTMEYKVDKMKVVVNGMQIPDPPQQEQKPVTMTLSKLGKPLKVEGLDQSAFGHFDFSRFMSFAPSAFPDKDVKAGDSWDASPDPEVFPMKMTGKLLSIKKMGGKEIGEVEYSFDMPGEAFGKLMKKITGKEEVDVTGAGIKGTSSTMVDLATGIPGAGKGTMDMDFTIRVMGQEIRQVMKMNLTIEVGK